MKKQLLILCEQLGDYGNIGRLLFKDYTDEQLSDLKESLVDLLESIHAERKNRGV